jgi:putative redox protein
LIEITATYEGQLRCRAVHGPSLNHLLSDAPVDNRGRGETFSPTDLVATALGTCMLTTMGIRAGDNGLNIDGSRVRVVKRMTTLGPRKIHSLQTTLQIARGLHLGDAAKQLLQQAALTCPVKLSLAETIEVPVTFEWLA